MRSEELRAAVSGLMGRAQEDLSELVAFKSIADARQYPPQECERAAQWVVDAFSELGLRDVQASRTSDGSLAVHGGVPAPDGAPTVLLYSHYDVQPPMAEERWTSPPFALTERDGRWYGRGAADCKGNVVVHLTALRALAQVHGGFPCGVTVICEGSEEQGSAGLDAFVPDNVELLRADTILICDTGNFAAGVPTLTTALRGMTVVDITLSALASAMHSGQFGGAAPDPLAGLIAVLASLHDERGDTTVEGLESGGRWDGVDYPAEQFRDDATVLDGVALIGSGAVADMLWARPSATVLGIDVPPVVGAVNAVQASVRARVGLRIPPGANGAAAQDALVAHLRARVPWNLRCEIDRVAVADPFVGSLRGPGYESLKAALEESYGRATTTAGEGGSIPLCNVLAKTYPDAEIFLLGVEEPKCLIHAPNESVNPSEIEHVALAEALFLCNYAEAKR